MSLRQTNQWLKLTRISSDCSTTTTNLTHLYQQKQTWINFMACTFSLSQGDNILVTWTTSIKRPTLKSWWQMEGGSLIWQSPPALDLSWLRAQADGRRWLKRGQEKEKGHCLKIAVFKMWTDVWNVRRFSVNYTCFILHKCCLEDNQQPKFSYPRKPGWGTELPPHWVWGSHENGHKQCSPLIYSYPSNRTSEIHYF